MSKRRSDTQLTKDDYEAQMNGGFNFSANRVNSEGGPDDQADPSKMADSKVMMGRKIAPLKRGRARGGAASSSRGGGSSLPNFFAGTPSTVFGSNGTTQQPADGAMGGFGGSFGTPNAAPTAPGFGGNATGGFNFGGNNGVAEQPKVNPFGSLTPSASSASTNGGGGMFGQTQQPSMGSSLFGNTPASQNASSGGLFGNNNNNNSSTASPAPTSSGFLFGGNNNNTAPTASATSFNKPSSFAFGGGSTAPPMFGGGDNKPAASSSFTFGSNTATPAVTPPTTSSFNFGASTATAPAAGTGGYFGAPSPAPEKTPEPATPTTAPPAPSFQFGAATPTQSSLFGKPAEPQQSLSLFAKPTESQQGSSLFGKSAEPQQGLSLFGRPTPSPEPSSNLFTPSKPSPEPNLFGSPAPVQTPAAKGFFEQPKPQEQAKSSFGFHAEPAKEAPKSFFGGFGPPAAEKKEEPSKPLFGFGAATEKKQEPAKETPKAQSPFSFGAPPAKDDDDDDAMDENSPPKQSIFDSQVVTNNNSFSGFGSPKSAFAAAPTNQFTPPPMFAPTTSTAVAKTTTSTTITNARTPSPPIPSEATSWTPAQLTEYYNLYALRALNFSFFENLKQADPMGDWSVACEVYIKETARIKGCQENGERYKGADSKAISGVSTKRSTFSGGSESESEGGGKRRKDNSEDSKASSDSSRALAGILGGGSSAPDLTQKPASKPVFGFKPPTASASSNPGQQLAAKPLFEFKPPTASALEPAAALDLGQKLPSKPVFSFKPPTASTPSLSDQGQRLAAKPLFGFQPPAPMTANNLEKKTGGSVFDNPSAPANNGGFVNPFAAHKPDPNDKDMDDEESDGDDKQPSGTSTPGSLFGRVSEPKPSTTTSAGIFGAQSKSTTPSGGLFSNNTWGSDKGVKFGEAPTNGNGIGNGVGNGSIFGAKPSSDQKPSFFGSSASSAVTTPGASATSSLFGTPGPKPEVGFSFGGNGTTKPSGPISIPSSSRGASAAPDDASSEPNDNAHLAKNELDLSAQGPGEEDEDSLFQVRAIIYEIVPGGAPAKKAGVGTLRVLKNRLTKKARVITRTPSGKVVLNVGLVKEISYALGEKGGKNVSLVEFLPSGKPPKRYSVRVKEEEMAIQLGKVLESAKMGS